MLRGLFVTILMFATLSGCARLADSRLNPLNWFGRSQPEAAAAADPAELRPLVPETRQTQVVDGRALIAQITEMSIDRSPYGAIVHATGLAQTQGYFNAELVPAGVDGSTLVLDFRVEAPANFESTGSARSRSVIAAYVIEPDMLAAIRSVRVRGAQNSRVSRR